MFAPSTFSYPTVDTLVFKGDRENTFLAPRGVFVYKQKLLVADTAQNRVFIWNILPTTEHAKPDVVLGQISVNGTGRNNHQEASAATLQYPSGLWTDGKKLVVADAWNHRVLIWHSFPSTHGHAADVVIGQPDFSSNQPNIKGLAHHPTEKSLYWCYGVWVDGNRLFVADTGNRRVMIYNTIPTENFTAADEVIGASGFHDRDYNAEWAVWPYSVKVNSIGQIAITDTQYFRVLIYNSLQQAVKNENPTVLGQPDLASNGQNQFRLKPDANTLSWCYDSHFYRNGIWVADTGNSRLLWFDDMNNNAFADALIGHADFSIGSENLETIRSTDRSLYWPFAISIYQQQMAVADTGNHRIVLIQLPHLP